MAWNRFNILVLLQIFGIGAVGLLFTISLQQEYLLMTTVGLAIVWMGQILFLNYYMNRIHRDVRKFMEALKNQDTAQLFNKETQGRYFKKLYASFNEITRNFRLVRIEREVENQFFRETINQSASGILALTEDGAISLSNKATLQILGMEDLKNISELSEIHPALAEILSQGDPKVSHVKLMVHGKMLQVAVKGTEMKLQGTGVRIYSLLDISSEMARNEVEAWQKLIRVLNHEITNSVTPIHILSTSLLDLFHVGKQQKSPGQFDKQMIDRVELGLKTIAKRSGGLADFLNTYKSFTKISKADYSKVKLTKLLQHILSLLSHEIEKSGVDINFECSPPDLRILADEKLIEQTIINLIKNSLHASEELDQASIRIRAMQNEDQVVIEVTDNGKGVAEEIIDHIFTPFFTTRKKGSGIGLSLALQVMQLHNGSIHVKSEEGVQTTFTLVF